jgi:hypothetical protein
VNGRIGNWRLEISEGGSIGFLVSGNGPPHVAATTTSRRVAQPVLRSALDFGLAISDWGLGKERPAVSARGYSGKGSAQLFLAGFSSRTVNVYGGPVEKLP